MDLQFCSLHSTPRIPPLSPCSSRNPHQPLEASMMRPFPKIIQRGPCRDPPSPPGRRRGPVPHRQQGDDRGARRPGRTSPRSFANPAGSSDPSTSRASRADPLRAPNNFMNEPPTRGSILSWAGPLVRPCPWRTSWKSSMRMRQRGHVTV